MSTIDNDLEARTLFSDAFSVPVGVCFDQGRIAAMNGFTVLVNPYYSDVEPKAFAAWLRGYNDEKLKGS